MKYILVTLFIVFSCLQAGYSQSNSDLEISNHRFSRYFEGVDSSNIHINDSIWTKYQVSFIASDPDKIKEFYICLGSENDSADILIQKVKIIEKNGIFYTNGYQETPIYLQNIYTVVRLKRRDIKRIRNFNIYVVDVNDKKLLPLKKKQ